MYQHINFFFYRGFKVFLFLLFINILAGCASVPYQYGHQIEDEKTLQLRPGESQVERGDPEPFLDGLGHYVLSLPSKFVLWSWKVDNHNISEETEEKLLQYLADNDLDNVKVRINQYEPADEWSRLRRNKAASAGWRYTIGAISVLSYTLFPGRLFGGDNYNPYTNTINIYSDLKPVVVHEGAHAKDMAERTYKGTYAALRILPIVPLFQEAKATGDAIGYDRVNCLVEDEKVDYKILYPAYGTYIAGEGVRFVGLPQWVQLAINIAAVIPGHIIGPIKAATVKPMPGCETLEQN